MGMPAASSLGVSLRNQKDESETIAELNGVLGTEVSLKATPQREDKGGGTKPGRKAIAAHAPRVAIVHDLAKGLTAAVGFEARGFLLGPKSVHVTTHYSRPKLGSLIEASEKGCAPWSRKCHALAVLPARAEAKSLILVARDRLEPSTSAEMTATVELALHVSRSVHS
jgi:hypothetical protein